MRVLILAPFAEESLARLTAAGITPVHESWLESGELQDPKLLGERIASEQLDAVVVEADFLFAETFDAAPGLKFAGICRSATNQVDVEAATERGIVVVNTPGRNAASVAELTLGLMLAAARRIPGLDRYVRARNWDSPTTPYREFRGTELGGKTVGIVGLGAIGSKVAGLCKPFGMNVTGYDPFVSPEQAKQAGVTWVELSMLLKTADIVTLHAPPAEDGTFLLDANQISSMKRGAILVNTASAELVDEAALVEALSTGKLSVAGIDIFPTHPVDPTNPLLSLPNVVLTPHIGGATEETIKRHSAAMTGDLIRFARGVKPRNLVNPEAWEHARGST
jgi:D-3-phosphoglycerate dehydrogenase